MAIGQNTIKVQDMAHERREGTTDIMFVSEAVAQKLQAKDRTRYKILGEIKETGSKPRAAEAEKK